MKDIIVVTEINARTLDETESWLVIGPCCWGRSRSLSVALSNAASQKSYVEGTFTARVVPAGELWIDDTGSYRIEGWTDEQQARANTTTRLVAVTKAAARKWSKQAQTLAKQHLKEFRAALKKP